MSGFLVVGEVTGVKLYVKDGGMVCEHCRSTVRSALLELRFVHSAALCSRRGQPSGSLDCFELEVDDDVRHQLAEAKASIAERVGWAGYSCTERSITLAPPPSDTLVAAGKLLATAAGILVLAGALKLALGYDFLSVIPSIDSTLTLGALFAAGLMTSVHCMGMCGSLTLAASLAATERRSALQPLLFNLGRLVSYTAFGALAGAVGSVFKLASWASGALMMAAAMLMLLMALQLGGALRMPSVRLPAVLKQVPAVAGPFALGLFNALMPCGPLQAMQLYALASGSALMGAASMAAFCLGTVPLLLGFGLVSNLAKGRARGIMQTAGAGLMLVLSVGMLYRGALSCGLVPQQQGVQSFEGYVAAAVAPDSSVQEAAFELEFSGYQDLLLQAGVPARITIRADAGRLTGCNNALQIPEWDVEQELHAGDNIIEFTPAKAGVYRYSCWMNMLDSTIAVVEDIDRPVLPASTEESGGPSDE